MLNAQYTALRDCFEVGMTFEEAMESAEFPMDHSDALRAEAAEYWGEWLDTPIAREYRARR